MKFNNLFFIIALCAVLQCNVSFAKNHTATAQQITTQAPLNEKNFASQKEETEKTKKESIKETQKK